MCNCHETKKCSKKRCVKKYVIKSLPYLINKPGHYCLCKDFTWTLTENNSAITIVNVKNVVLDFNQKKITVVTPANPEPTYKPTVLAFNTFGAIFQNVHLEGFEGGKNTAPGLHMFSCSNVDIRSPHFIDMGEFFDGAALRISGSADVNVSKLNLDNFTSGFFHYGSVFDNVNKFTMTEAQVQGSVLFFTNCTNGDILRCQLDSLAAANLNRGIIIETNNNNPGVFSSNIRIADCNITVKDWYGIFISAFGDVAFEPEFAGQNILIENNLIVADEAGSDNLGTGIYVQLGSDVVIRNNQVHVRGKGNLSPTAGIALCDTSRCTVENNSVFCTKGAELGIHVFGDGDLSSGSDANTIRGNIVSSDGTGLEGISFFSFLKEQIKYNTVNRNVVSCFLVGYTDNNATECTIFSNNIANGNTTNYDINTAAPVNSFDVNNFEGCSKPAPLSLKNESKVHKKRELVARRERK